MCFLLANRWRNEAARESLPSGRRTGLPERVSEKNGPESACAALPSALRVARNLKMGRKRRDSYTSREIAGSQQTDWRREADSNRSSAF